MVASTGACLLLCSCLNKRDYTRAHARGCVQCEVAASFQGITTERIQSAFSVGERLRILEQLAFADHFEKFLEGRLGF